MSLPHEFIVPTTKTQINPTDERYFLIDNHGFLMMRPEENTTARVMIRMSNDLRMNMTRRRARMTSSLPARTHFDKSSLTLANQCTFGMNTVQAHGKGDFFENKHVHTNAIVLVIRHIPAFGRSFEDEDLTAIFPNRLSNRNVSSSVGLTIIISGDSHQSVMNTSSFAVRSALATDSM